MNEWNANSPETHPPCQVPCIIRTKDGRELEAQLVHLNGEYHSRITKAKLYKWRLGKHNFIEDNEVKEWREQAERPCVKCGTRESE